MTGFVVFAGRGSSHSWTWFADFLEEAGVYDARFLDSIEFIETLGHRPGTVVISGGDGFAIADSMKGVGFERMKHSVHKGTQYAGICAGAYLPLPSSVEPFNEFNISTTKIDNIECAPTTDTHPRLAAQYGTCSVFHAVRGEVELSRDGKRTRAPLYGGPVFREPGKDAVLVRYAGFGSDTEFQIDRDRAENLMLGKPAGIRCEYGDGRLLLFGPHLEHPDYPEANLLLREMLGIEPPFRRPARREGKTPSSLASTVADLKIAAMGLEGRSFIVGRKLWDASRFLELAKAIEKRAWSLGHEDAERIRADLDTIRSILLRTKIGVESDVDEATVLLVNSARVCVDSHFRSMVEGR